MIGKIPQQSLRELTDSIMPQGFDPRNLLRDNFDASLDSYLKLFDFPVNLPVKRSNTMRLYYNNCNGLEINKTIHTIIQTRKDKI